MRLTMQKILDRQSKVLRAKVTRQIGNKGSER